MQMARTTELSGVELLMSEPEIVAWLELDDRTDEDEEAAGAAGDA
jgi:hypothetical protein